MDIRYLLYVGCWVMRTTGRNSLFELKAVVRITVRQGKKEDTVAKLFVILPAKKLRKGVAGLQGKQWLAAENNDAR